MNNLELKPRRLWGLTAATFMAALLFSALSAFAQDPVVNSADPSSAEQETIDLVIMVGGDNFGSDSVVDFIVSCDPVLDPECVPGDSGVVVKKVKRQGPKTLKVTVDVSAGAQTRYKLDIQVRSRGRTGKGIELFRVLEKTHPNQDTIPPGEPTDLRVIEEKYGSVKLSFTMPADDGYDAASGWVWTCTYAGLFWPLVAPGQEQVVGLMQLEPETEYLIGVKCRDEAGNWSSEAEVIATTRPFSEFQDPTWSIDEVPFALDDLVGHQFDAAGNPVIAGVVYLWDQRGKGAWAPLPAVIRLITGVLDEGTGSWTWSKEDISGFEGDAGVRVQWGPTTEFQYRFRTDRHGQPAFVGRFSSNPKRGERELIYTFHDGAVWVSEVLTTDTGTLGSLGFAFDADDQPGVAWCSANSPGGVRLARRVSPDQWSIEVINEASCDFARGGVGELAFDGTGNPAISYSDKLAAGESDARVVSWTGSEWIEETTEYPGYTPHLTYDLVRGDFTTAGDGMRVCDRLGADNWQCDSAPFGYGLYHAGMISGIDSSGEFFMVHTTWAEQDVAVARRSPGASWTQEHVDFWRTRALPSEPWQQAFLAFDPLDLPTLSWTWNIGGCCALDEYHLYFAWKSTP